MAEYWGRGVILRRIRLPEKGGMLKKEKCMNTFLRRARLQRNLTQEELASALGTTAMSIWRWESGKLPSPFFRNVMCDYFHLSPAELGLALPAPFCEEQGSQISDPVPDRPDGP